MAPQQLVWFITGCSTGLGHFLTLAALKRGDRVIATARARSFSELKSLQAAGADALELDVSDSFETIQEVAQKAIAIHGRIDVVVNNAGYAQAAAFEELSTLEIMNQLNTNLFGALNVARAFLPFMRKARSGTIVWIGSISAWVPNTGISVYGASKAATRSLSESLNTEISHLGLRSIDVEFGLFRTDFCAPGHAIKYASRISDYDPLMGVVGTVLNGLDRNQPGDPEKGVEILLDLIRGEGVAEGREVPPVVGIGSDYYSDLTRVCTKTLQTLEEWKDVGCNTDIPKPS